MVILGREIVIHYGNSLSSANVSGRWGIKCYLCDCFINLGKKVLIIVSKIDRSDPSVGGV